MLVTYELSRQIVWINKWKEIVRWHGVIDGRLHGVIEDYDIPADVLRMT